MLNLWPLLLPAAAWSGWVVAMRRDKSRQQTVSNRLSKEYVVGLNYLLNEQPDEAVDVFIRLLEVDSDTVETHLALGSLFRRRGEVDRAIRIHQNLIARPQLSLEDKKDALLALGQDYMSAGLFDRAERIFLEVVELGGRTEYRSLHELLAIYQQEKSWFKALDIVKKLSYRSGESFNQQMAHYHCEIASEQIKSNQLDMASQTLKQALAIDKLSVRTSLLQADINMRQGQYKLAIRALRRVACQDANFVSETVDALVTCYQAINGMAECINYLKQRLNDQPRASMLFVIADYIAEHESKDAAIDFVASQLQKYPSIRGINRLIYWHLDNAQGKVREKLQMLYDITSKFLENKPIYRCSHCGFGGKHLHWLCPSCKQWGSTRPVQGLEGD